MHAEIVMIGSELLLGELIDTNAARLAKALRDIGMDLFFKATVDDDETRITSVLNLALDRSDVVITSGGIGPTVDDVTRQAVANATGRPLIYSRAFEEQIAERFRNFGRKMADNNRRQAYIPEGALPLPNPVGTAPCFLSEDMRGRGFIISLPGVPRELEYMMTNVVLPILIERMGGKKVTRVHILRTCAVGESNVDRAIGDLMSGSNPVVGLAAHAGQTDVRITAKAETRAEADALIDAMESEIRKRLGVAVYGTGKETVPEVVGCLMGERELKLGVVDTLTGGQLTREIIEAGFGGLIATDITVSSVADAMKSVGLTGHAPVLDDDGRDLAFSMVDRITPEGGIGLAMVGPFEDELTFYALNSPGNIRLIQKGRRFQDSDYGRRWLVIQGLDWIRRALLEEMTSPADWN